MKLLLLGLLPACPGLLAAGARRAGGAAQSRGGWQSSARDELCFVPWMVCRDKVDQRKTGLIYMCVCAYIDTYIYIK